MICNSRTLSTIRFAGLSRRIIDLMNVAALPIPARERESGQLAALGTPGSAFNSMHYFVRLADFQKLRFEPHIIYHRLTDSPRTREPGPGGAEPGVECLPQRVAIRLLSRAAPCVESHGTGDGVLLDH